MVDELTSHWTRYKVFNKKTFDMIITEARNFAVKELLPANAEGEKEGTAILKSGQVTVPAMLSSRVQTPAGGRVDIADRRP